VATVEELDDPATVDAIVDGVPCLDALNGGWCGLRKKFLVAILRPS
jgi:hypothetical protein